MKIIYAFVVAAVMLCRMGLTAFTGLAEASQGTWIGEISSSHCGVTHPQGAPARNCTLECVSEGAAFVLVSGGEVYRFADQTAEALGANAGATVKVTGELRGGVLTAFSIERAQSEGSR